MFSEMGTRSVLNMTDQNFFEPVKSTIKQLWLYSIPSLRSPYLKLSVLYTYQDYNIFHMVHLLWV